ncbi:MarR family winged helix-turn-helix transcriptional regulator [Nakamurella endophytica]|uniref:HTH marR-type domain-containing protein n=1 Tax=Nakamurella endophytica TaxID=1748367 RepID=A0A917T1D7_9ACTN|nr:MarR family winged helix-turn-helix transcriptional regulator [Nakamurella endophytica]GGM04833.1 hypothetical protein GCM10011594_26350 [Nakamurella endophytica]
MTAVDLPTDAAGAAGGGRTAGDGAPDHDAAAVQDSIEIAERMIAVLRAHGRLKARLSTGTEDFNATVLLVKLYKEGPRRASELAADLCADPSTVSRQVSGLVKAGLLERRADPDDGRASILWVTKAGRAQALEHTRRRGAALTPVVQGWSPDDRATFVRLLDLYADGLEQHRDRILHEVAPSRGPEPAGHGTTAAPAAPPAVGPPAGADPAAADPTRPTPAPTTTDDAATERAH